MVNGRKHTADTEQRSSEHVEAALAQAGNGAEQDRQRFSFPSAYI